jgi:hypothetical protein
MRLAEHLTETMSKAQNLTNSFDKTKGSDLPRLNNSEVFESLIQR